MIKHPTFKLEASGKDITNTIRQNLISLSFTDKEGNKSDEISFTLFGIYAKPVFGDKLKLWLGYHADTASEQAAILKRVARLCAHQVMIYIFVVLLACKQLAQTTKQIQQRLEQLL